MTENHQKRANGRLKACERRLLRKKRTTRARWGTIWLRALIASKNAQKVQTEKEQKKNKKGEYRQEVRPASVIGGADDFAQPLAPVLRAVRSEGATTLRSVAEALNRRGVKSQRGGIWHPSAVANLLARSGAFL
jgi:3-deoxy-D-arabino-heptulosonate 7-phosphate (DAHP) synthase